MSGLSPATGEQQSGHLNVAIVCPYDLGVPGGVQSHVFDVVAAMVTRGHTVAVLAPVSEPTAIARRLGSWPSWLTNAGPSHAVPINGSRAPVRLAWGQRRQVRQWLESVQPDVVHVHEPFVPALARPAVHVAHAWHRSDGRRLPVVGTFHASVESSLLLHLVAPLLRATARRLNRCIAVSAMAARTLREVGVRTQPTIIANPVDTERFARAALPKLPPAMESGHVLFLGRGDEPRKGLPDLLAAWPLVRAARPHAQLLVAGRASMEQLAGLAGVQLIGTVSEVDKPGVYAGADVYVAPHRGGESMGMVLVEAMAAGTAVVATDIPAFRAVAADGAAASLVAPRDPIALANALLHVLSDHAYRDALVATGMQRARDFDVTQILDEIETVYRSV